MLICVKEKVIVTCVELERNDVVDCSTCTKPAVSVNVRAAANSSPSAHGQTTAQFPLLEPSLGSTPPGLPCVSISLEVH